MNKITGKHKTVSIFLKMIVFVSAVTGTALSAYAAKDRFMGWQFAEGYNYPYFFLNWGSPAGAFGFTKGLPFMGTGWWILALLIFLLAVARCYLAVNDRIHGKSRRSVS